MTRALIHIGTTKTGTTSIQGFLHERKKALRSFGYHYPAKVKEGVETDIALAIACLDNPVGVSARKIKEILSEKGFPTDGHSSRFRDLVITHYRAEAEKAERDSKQLVISTERFWSQGTSKNHIQSIIDVLELAGIEISKLIMYVRPQISHLISDYQQNIKQADGILSFQEFCLRPAIKKKLDHNATRLAWCEALGRSDLIDVRPYNTIEFPNNDVVSDFAFNVMGIVSSNSLKAGTKIRNVSRFTIESLNFMRTFNLLYPRFNADGTRNPKRRELMQNGFLDYIYNRFSTPNCTPISPNKEVAYALHQTFKNSNLDLERTNPGLEFLNTDNEAYALREEGSTDHDSPASESEVSLIVTDFLSARQ